MKYFKLTVEVGHFGSGKSFTASRHIHAKDSADAMRVAMQIPRVKKVVGIEPVEDLRTLMKGLVKDVNEIWCVPRTASETIAMLINCAFKLGGVRRARARKVQAVQRVR